jgi:hypothetical protein
MIGEHALYTMADVAQAAGHAMKSDHHASFVPLSIIPVDVLARKYKKD